MHECGYVNTKDGGQSVNTEATDLGDFQIVPRDVAFAVIVVLFCIGALLVRAGVF